MKAFSVCIAFALISAACAYEPNRGDTKNPYESFNEWPLEKQIQEATVIAVGQNKEDNGEIRCVITEIIKRSPGIKFNLKIGDECEQGRYHRHNKLQNFGDGQIMFFTGNPATIKLLLAYSNNRIRVNEMTIGDLRGKIAELDQNTSGITTSE